MQVTIQDCGCIALPDEAMAELGLGAGTVFELAWSASLRTLTLVASARPGDTIKAISAKAACPVRTAI